jgi:hypothetical protein
LAEGAESIKAASTSQQSYDMLIDHFARIERDEALYGEDTGLEDVSQDVKKYVKSLFGATRPQYKQVSGLKFTKSTAD